MSDFIPLAVLASPNGAASAHPVHTPDLGSYDYSNGRNYQRHIDHWRPVHGWKETAVWAIMERYGINPHPAYRLGWGRCSCSFCIFSSHDHWASLWAINPDAIREIARLEEKFAFTMHNTMPIMQRVEAGSPFDMDPFDVAAAMSTEWNEPIILPSGAWKLPAGPSSMVRAVPLRAAGKKSQFREFCSFSSPTCVL